MKNNIKVENSLKLLAKTSTFVLVAVLLSKLFTYSYRIIVARYFGPEIYGLFILAIMVMSLFITFSSFGLPEGILRYISFYRGKKAKSKIKYLVKIAIVILSISSIVSAILLFLFSDAIAVGIFHNQSLSIFLKVFSILIPINIFANLLLAIMRSHEKIIVYSFIVNIFQNLLKLIILIALIIFGFVASSIIISYAISAILMLFIAYLYVKYKIPDVFGKSSISKKPKIRLKRELLIYSWPVMFLGVIQGFFYQTDSFFIGFFRDISTVGLYNAAVPIIALLGIPSELFMQLFFPLITREFSKKNFKVIKELSQQVGKWILLLNVPLFLAIFLFPEMILNILFGEVFVGASRALRILSIGGIISSLMVLTSSLLLMAGRSRLILFNVVGVSIFNIVLNFILIPKYGMVGAAISTILSWAILSIILFFQVYKILSIVPLRRDIIKIFIISAGLLGVFFYLKNLIVLNLVYFFGLLVLLVLSYFFLILITNSLDKNDFLIIKSFRDKIYGFFANK